MRIGSRLNMIKRAELAEAETSVMVAYDLAVRLALEAAGVEFIDENGGGPGLRFIKCPRFLRLNNTPIQRSRRSTCQLTYTHSACETEETGC